MKKQILSFKYAFCGVWNAIKSESHMRFHIVAGFYVLLFSLFYDFSLAQRALLVVLIALIIAFEIVNTCIEELCNLISTSFMPLIKLIKDMAAGAVLVLSMASVVVAFLFFWDLSVIMSILKFFLGNILLFCLLILSTVIAVIFVALGPVGIKNIFINRKVKKH